MLTVNNSPRHAHSIGFQPVTMQFSVSFRVFRGKVKVKVKVMVPSVRSWLRSYIYNSSTKRRFVLKKGVSGLSDTPNLFISSLQAVFTPSSLHSKQSSLQANRLGEHCISPTLSPWRVFRELLQGHSSVPPHSVS